MAKPKFILLGHSDYLLIDICVALINSGFDVTAVTPSNSRLAKVKGLARHINLPRYQESEFAEFLISNPDLLEGLDGVFIWCGDDLMRILAKSKLPESLKTKILPTGDAESLQILGSKTGQSWFFEKSGAANPVSYRIEAGGSLPDTSNWHGSFVKGDRFSGGGFVREYSKFGMTELSEIPRDWYPIVLQEKLEGTLVSVEACYFRGALIYWMYSEVVADSYEFGPSVSRRYLDPIEKDFVADLAKLGKSGDLSGMFNVGLVRDDNSGRHKFFEFDSRPNIWHHQFAVLNIDLVAALSGELEIPLYPELTEPRIFYEPQRLFSDRLRKWRLVDCVRILRGRRFEGLGEPMANSFYQREALAKNWMKLFFFPINRFRGAVLRHMVGINRFMPDSLKERVKKSPLKRFLVGLLTD